MTLSSCRVSANPGGALYANKKILVTGAGGSIGSGLVQALSEAGCNLVLIDHSEYLLFQTLQRFPAKSYLADLRDRERVASILVAEKPDIVFHAAALKHVPLMEENPTEAIKTNVLGTKNLIELSVEAGVERFVFISSDKAVKPASVMGASKRIGEMLCYHYREHGKTVFTAVRFGNVLGSSGSVIPLFKEQIDRGGPVTVTDKDMERYFMSIRQACRLVMKTGEMGRSGEIYLLDMGEPVRIYDLARAMILAEGKMPDVDIELRVTGLRPGEKLREEIYRDSEATGPTDVPGIRQVKMIGNPEGFEADLARLLEAKSGESIRALFAAMIDDYRKSDG
ncbi:MAG: hypothetical protein CVV45_07005 [Spirochaetae bacterium HGW-Spirochaetae-10]|nr:MAG: hypothetical protein CVV45_07005 [Spirochaetae bacterium HGW-Spirochaetae-10]